MLIPRVKRGSPLGEASTPVGDYATVIYRLFEISKMHAKSRFQKDLFVETN